MNKREFHEMLQYELFDGKQLGIIGRIRTLFFQPNTNCIYLARKMWYFNSLKYSGGGLGKFYYLRAKFLHLKILKRYGCCIFLNAEIAKGFYIEHPVGIVIGRCEVGENFHIYQNSTIGVRHRFDDSNGFYPHIGNNVTVGCNCAILGNVRVSDGITIGANSVVVKDLIAAGTYVGSPASRVR